MEKMKQWSLLTALGVIGVMAAGWFLLVSPQHAHAKDLRTQAQGVQQSTQGLMTQVQQLKAQQKGVAAQQRTLMKIATQIPNNPALPTLIRQLSAAAHDTGVTLVSLSPAQPTLVTTAATVTASPLAQIPISVQVSGSYFNIEGFFRSVEHLSRAFLATGFTLSPNGNSGTASTNTTTGSTSDPVTAAPGALMANVQAVVFMSPDSAAAASTTAPQTPTAPATTATTGTTTPATSSSTPANAAPAANPAQ